MTDSFDVQPKRQLNIRKPYLELISKGIKTVEVRVGYPSMRKIQPDQDLGFISGNDTVVTRVKRVTEYSSFEDVLTQEDPISIGGELGESKEELLTVIRGIYPLEKEQLGVLAIEIELTVS